MTQPELDHVEFELGIQLPEEYRKLVSPFPIPTYQGTGEDEGLPLWDSPRDIIALNLEMRQGKWGAAPWPDYLFAVGRDDSGSVHALDCRSVPPVVIWSHSGHFQGAEKQDNPSLSTWSEEVLESIRVDLFERRIDESLLPQERKATEDAETAKTLKGCLIWIGGFVIAILLIRGCLAFL